jgi:Zn-dependent protease with chaperone function
MEYHGRLPDEGINTSPEHPLRELALLFGGLVGVVLVATLLAGLLVDRLVPLLPADLEVRLFASWLSPDGLSEDDPDTRTPAVQALLDRMAAHWEGHPYAFRVGLLEDPAPNALALPGGALLVTTGLLERVESENALALVLGHELGHYHARDHLRGLGRGVALALALGALDANLAGSLAGLAADLTTRRFGRDQERAADAFGLTLLQAEYGHVAGADAFFARMAEEAEAEGGDGPLAAYLATHPLHRDRVAALEARARKAGWPRDGPLRPLALGAE